jgi:hypothetical protein
MKIYNEITTVYNDDTGKWETISEDSYDYSGPLDLAQDEDDYFAQYGTDIPVDLTDDELTEWMGNTDTLAQLGADPEMMEQMLSHMGIRDAGNNLQYIDPFDPALVNLNLKQYEHAVDSSHVDLQKSLMDSINSPMTIDASGAEEVGGGGTPWGSSVIPQLQDINTSQITREFMDNKQAMQMGMEKQNLQEMDAWSQQFYNQVGNLYAAQNPACFRAGTKISTPEGNKNIEDIIAGDVVLAYDTKNKEYINRKVYDTHIHLNNKDGLILNNSLKTTKNHHFYTTDGDWIAAEFLKKGHKIIDNKGGVKLIKSIKLDANPYSVYNFEVRKDHNYFANGYLAHNGKGK